MGTLYQHLANMRRIIESSSYLEMLHKLHKKTDGTVPMVRLTPRGKEVFALIVEGMSSKHISECLGISESGVRRHKEKMLIQNKCSSLLELLAKYHGKDSGQVDTVTR
jgi:DNA-binding CsgD family transcriptional regulator